MSLRVDLIRLEGASFLHVRKEIKPSQALFCFSEMRERTDHCQAMQYDTCTSRKFHVERQVYQLCCCTCRNVAILLDLEDIDSYVVSLYTAEVIEFVPFLMLFQNNIITPLEMVYRSFVSNGNFWVGFLE